MEGEPKIEEPKSAEQLLAERTREVNKEAKEKGIKISICAICLKEYGRKSVVDGNGSGVSHGLCADCLKKEMDKLE